MLYLLHFINSQHLRYSFYKSFSSLLKAIYDFYLESYVFKFIGNYENTVSCNGNLYATKEKYPIMRKRNEYSEINVFIGAVKHFPTHVLTQLWHKKVFLSLFPPNGLFYFWWFLHLPKVNVVNNLCTIETIIVYNKDKSNYT